MSKIVNSENPGQIRNRFLKELVIGIQTSKLKTSVDKESLDLVAYMIYLLRAINETIEPTCLAWEKRDYWLKADKFRLKWDWIHHKENKLYTAIINEDWPKIASTIAEIGLKLNNINPSKRKIPGKAWEGCWEKLKLE